MKVEICRVVGANIRERRLTRGWTLVELGTSLGVSYQQLQKYEKGTNRLPVDMLVTLARSFGCSLDELCGLKSIEMDPQLIPVLKRISSMSPALREKFIALTEFFEEPVT